MGTVSLTAVLICSTAVLAASGLTSAAGAAVLACSAADLAASVAAGTSGFAVLLFSCSPRTHQASGNQHTQSNF